MMNYAILYGFLSGFALLLGALPGLYFKVPKRIIALIMAFGCGILISSLSIDLMGEAFEMSNNSLMIGIGFIAGALLFVGGNAVIENLGGKNRKSTVLIARPKEETTSGTAILLGTLLDGIPESLVMGAALAAGQNAGIVYVIAVFLSNFPEGISGSIAMKNSGFKNSKILLIWFSMLLLTLLFTVIGYQFLGNAPVLFKSSAMAFASGAIIAMLSDSMLPEAFKEGGRFTGVVVAIGFLTAFLLTKLT